MLVRRQPERALVHLRDLPEASLEVASRLVLHATVLDKHGEVVASIFTSVPAKVVDVAIEGEGPCGLELVSEQLLDLSLVDVQTHAVNGVLESGVLAATQ